MNLSHRESQALFAIMQALSDSFDHDVLRQRLGKHLLRLLGADHFASYVHDELSGRFGSVVQQNMSWDNLIAYDTYYCDHDPVTPRMQLCHGAACVSAIVPHRELRKTAFFNDFLRHDGLCYGMNFFARIDGQHVGDFRIWRGTHRGDFTRRDSELLDSIGPSLTTALARAATLPSTKVHTTGPAPGVDRSGAVQAEVVSQFGLSPREAQVVVLIAEGLSDVQIAKRLGFAKSTLRTHISSIFRKCGLQRRSQVVRALRSTSPH